MRDIFEIIEEQTLGCDFIETDFSSHHKQMEFGEAKRQNLGVSYIMTSQLTLSCI